MADPEKSIETFRSKVYAAALELFEGDPGMAESWPSKPLPAIGNETPINYIDTPERAQQLLDVIGRLEHGVWT